MPTTRLFLEDLEDETRFVASNFVVREFALVASPSAHVFSDKGDVSKCIQVHANWACAAAEKNQINFLFSEVVSCSIDVAAMFLDLFSFKFFF